jgi:arginase
MLRENKVLAFTMTDVDRFGIGRVMERAVAHLGDKGSLHLSLDIDGTDPSVAPSTGTTALGGLSYRESHFVCEAVAATGLLGSMDLVEVNPDLGTKEDAVLTGKAAVGLIGSALGRTIL